MGDDTKVKVKLLGAINLQLAARKFFVATIKFLELHQVAFIPSAKRNLMSVSILDKFDYTFHFENGKVLMYCGALWLVMECYVENFNVLFWVIFISLILPLLMLFVIIRVLELMRALLCGDINVLVIFLNKEFKDW